MIVSANLRFSPMPLPERVSLLYLRAGSDAPRVALIAVAAAFALWPYVGTDLVVALLLWLAAASALRYAMARVYRRVQPPPAAAVRWENYFCLASALVGAAWGLALALLVPVPQTLPAFTLAFLVGGIAMGLPAALAPSSKAYASFILPMLLPAAALSLRAGGAFTFSAGLSLLVCAAVLLALYLSAHRALVESMQGGREQAQLRQRLDLAMQSSAISIWEWDARRGTVYLDAALAQITDDAPRERYLTLEELALMVHPEDIGAVRRAQAECVKGAREQYRIEHRLRTRGGDWVWVLSRGRVIERAADGSALRMAGTNVDITQRKRAEAELLAALQREKELSEMKSRFVSVASHELRTPLATILSSSELLQYYAEKISAEDRAKMLQAIQGAVKRMNGLIEDVLIVGKAQAGTLQFEPKPLDLRLACEKMVAEMRAGAGSGHELRFEQRFARANVDVDERLLRYIVGNLLSNAVKYSAPGSVVSLLLEERDGMALLEVADQGIGIPEADQARVFDSFHRAANVGSRAGTGLGLVIVKKAVELHGGDIAIESKLDVGTRVSVRLPLAQTQLKRMA